jgi:hypothetical protein
MSLVEDYNRYIMGLLYMFCFGRFFTCTSRQEPTGAKPIGYDENPRHSTHVVHFAAVNNPVCILQCACSLICYVPNYHGLRRTFSISMTSLPRTKESRQDYPSRLRFLPHGWVRGSLQHPSSQGMIQRSTVDSSHLRKCLPCSPLR